MTCGAGFLTILLFEMTSSSIALLRLSVDCDLAIEKATSMPQPKSIVQQPYRPGSFILRNQTGYGHGGIGDLINVNPRTGQRFEYRRNNTRHVPVPACNNGDNRAVLKRSTGNIDDL